MRMKIDIGLSASQCRKILFDVADIRLLVDHRRQMIKRTAVAAYNNRVLQAVIAETNGPTQGIL